MRATSTSSNVRAEALDPPAVAARAVRRPVVERVAPVLPVRVQRVGRRARHLAVREQLRPRGDVGADVGDVDRDVADQPDAARRARTRAARSTRARSAPGRRCEPRAGEPRPVADPVRMPRDEVLDLRRRDGAPRARRGAPASAANADVVRYGEPNSSGGPSGSICHHDWPGGGEPVDEAVRLAAEPAARQRGRMEQDSGGRGISFTFPILRPYVRLACVPLPKTTAPPPRIQILEVTPAGRLRALSGEARRRRPRRRAARGSSATATTCSARPSATGRPARRAGSRRRSRRSRQRPLGRARSTSTGRACGRSASRRGSTASRRSRRSCAARSTAGQDDLARRALRGRRPARPRDADASRRRSPRRRATATAAATSQALASTSTASSRASAPGTSSSRARGAASTASASCCRGSRSSASTSSTCRRSTRSGARTARAATTRSTARPERPGQPVGDRRRRRAATTRSTRSSARSREFERLVAEAKTHGIEIALDFAIQCSPDHPWLKEHPEWFNRRPDGTLKYAENPPKRYQDIYNVNFDCEDWKGLWEALRDVVLALGRARRHRVPRRQPAHEAGRRSGSG